MSGLTGHINHLYEDPNLTLSDIVKIYRSIANQSKDIKIYEKVDGYNIYLSYSAKHKQARLLRNNSQIGTGGVGLQELKEEFTTKKIQANKKAVPSNIVFAYTSLIEYFEKIVRAILPTEEQQKGVFGEDTSGSPEFFFNAEIIDPSAPNVIKYKKKMIIFHRLGNIKVDSASGKISATDTDEVTNHYAELQKLLGSSGDNGIELTDDKESTVTTVNKKELEIELGLLRAEFKKFDLDMEDTIGKYLIKSIERYLASHKQRFDSSEKEFVVKSILAVGFGSKFLIKPKLNATLGMNGQPQASLKNFTNETPAMELFKTLRLPIERILFNCSSLILDKYESLYIADNKQTTNDIIHLINKAIDDIKTNGTTTQKDRLNKNLDKLKSSPIQFNELINNPVEGLVFQFHSHTYKITSSFGPVNQIVNMRINHMEALSENKKIEPIEANGIKVLFAGAFKPPHKGHLEVIKNFIKLPELNKRNFTVEKVVVILGNKSRFSTNKHEFNIQQSRELFKLFVRAAGLESLVELRITQRDNPVKDVYDYISNPNSEADKAQPGDVILLGVSAKDRDYYSNLAKFVKDKPWRVLFGEDYEIPMVFKDKNNEGADILGEFSASSFREAIADSNIKEIDSFLPEEILSSPDYKKEAYKILGVNLPAAEMKESKLIDIISSKLNTTVINKPIKLNLNELINRVNSIYTR